MADPSEPDTEGVRPDSTDPAAPPLTLTRVAVVIAASVPLASGVFWLYLHAVYTAYYGAFGVTLEQVGLAQSAILARAGGWTLLLVTIVLGPYVFVVACARAILNAGNSQAPQWSAGASVAVLVLGMIASLVLAGQVASAGFVVILIFFALVAILVAAAVLVVDSWDRAARVRAASRHARVPLVTLLVFLTAVFAYGSVEAAPGAARQAFGLAAQGRGSDALPPSFEQAVVNLLAVPDVVEVQVKPASEDVAGLCGSGADVTYMRLGWTPDALTLVEVEQRRAAPTASGGPTFSVITVPPDAYSVRTAGRPATVGSPCF